MKKRLLSSVLAFLLVFTMEVPISFANANTEISDQKVIEAETTGEESASSKENLVVEEDSDTSVIAEESEETTGTFNEFGMAIAELNRRGREENNNSGDSVAQEKLVARYVMVKATRGDFDFSEYAPEEVIAGPDNYYYLAFDSEASAAAAAALLDTREDIVYAEQDSIVYGDEMETKDSGDSSEEDWNVTGDSIGYHSWGVEYTGLHLFAQTIDTTNSIVVAVVDSGVDKNHVDLKSRLTSKEYDYVDGDSVAMDVHGHGTSVAGIVADATQGLNVKIMPVRVLNEKNQGTASWIASGIRYAADNGAKVINLSLGGDHNNTKEDAISYAIGKGCIVIVSAGNSSGSVDTYCPAHIAECITVGAIDANGMIADYSNYGNAVDFAAPGVDISACKLGGGYREFDGTSAAVSHVSAFAAMYLLKNPSHSLTSLVNYMGIWADDAGDKGQDAYYGRGIINAGDACGYAKVVYKNGNGKPDTCDWPIKGSDYTIPSRIPFRLGYSFQGWTYTMNGSTNTINIGDKIKATYGLTFTAKWVGGSIAISRDEVAYSAWVDNKTTTDGTFYKFTPMSPGTYVIQSSGTYDTKVDIYNSKGELIAQDDDGGVCSNFRNECYLAADTTYYFHVYEYFKHPAEFDLYVYRKALGEYTVNYYFNNSSTAKTFTNCVQLNSRLIQDNTINAMEQQTGWATKPGGMATYKIGSLYTEKKSITLYSTWDDVPTISAVPARVTSELSGRNGYKSWRFVAPKTGTYVFSAIGTRPIDMSIYNEGGSKLQSAQGTDVSKEVSLTAGQVVYFYIGHTEDSYVEIEGSINLNTFGPAYAQLVCDVPMDGWYSTDIPKNYYTFKAPKTGTYFFHSSGDSDPMVTAYSSESNMISGASILGQDDDGGVGRNFWMSLSLTAGQTVYLCVKTAVSEQSGRYTIMVEKQIDDLAYSHTLTLQNNLSINYYVSAAKLNGFSNVKLVIEKDTYDKDGNCTVTESTISGSLVNVGYGDEYKFTYAGIASYEVGNEIRAHIIAVKDGNTYTFNTDTYSVKTYCYNQLKKTSATAELKTLIVDLLNYGSRAQTYFGIRTNELANADLTSTQKKYGTVTGQPLTSCASEKKISNALTTISGKTLVLGNNVEIKVYMTIPDILDTSKIKLKYEYVNMSGTKVTKEVPFSRFVYNSSTNEYSVRIADLMAPEFRTPVKIAIYSNTTQISNQHQYSIETYAYNRVNSSSSTTAMKNLVKAMMIYSDSAKAYFNK